MLLAQERKSILPTHLPTKVREALAQSPAGQPASSDIRSSWKRSSARRFSQALRGYDYNRTETAGKASGVSAGGHCGFTNCNGSGTSVTRLIRVSHRENKLGKAGRKEIQRLCKSITAKISPAVCPCFPAFLIVFSELPGEDFANDVLSDRNFLDIDVAHGDFVQQGFADGAE